MSMHAASTMQAQNRRCPQMTLKELADYWSQRFEPIDWEIVDELYTAIHEIVAKDPELALRTDPPHLVVASLTIATFWCDHLAQQSGRNNLTGQSTG
jgi:hypothetical protein